MERLEIWPEIVTARTTTHADHGESLREGFGRMDVVELLSRDHRAIKRFCVLKRPRHHHSTATAPRQTWYAKSPSTRATAHSCSNYVTRSVFGLPPRRTEKCDAPKNELPESLRRAMIFISANAGESTTLTDIAEAAFATPRAIQYAFQRHLNTTPMQYLRSVRLDRAHQDLRQGDPTSMTVTQAAARWGFSHVGRFARYYRRCYGQSPQATLKAYPTEQNWRATLSAAPAPDEHGVSRDMLLTDRTPSGAERWLRAECDDGQLAR